MGATFAIFNSSGKIPWDKDMFIIADKGLATSSATHFIKSALILSCPALFLLPSFLIIFKISSSLVGLKKQVALLWFWRYDEKFLPLWCMVSHKKTPPICKVGLGEIFFMVCNLQTPKRLRKLLGIPQLFEGKKLSFLGLVNAGQQISRGCFWLWN